MVEVFNKDWWISTKNWEVVYSNILTVSNPVNAKLAELISQWKNDFKEIYIDSRWNFLWNDWNFKHRVYLWYSISNDWFCHLTRYVDYKWWTINRNISDRDFPTFKMNPNCFQKIQKVSKWIVGKTYMWIVFQEKIIILKPIYSNIKYEWDWIFEVTRHDNKKWRFILWTMREENIKFQ